MADEFRLMKRPELDRIEQGALVAAGDAGGQLLDSWNATDMACLSPERWAEFIRMVVLSFGDSVRKQVVDNRAPF